MPDLLRADLTEQLRAVREGGLRVEELAFAVLDRAKDSEGRVGAYLTLEREAVLARARELDASRASGREPGPLFGAPVAVKDNIHVAGAPTTCASRILRGFIAPYDATVTRRLREAGALLLGKTNLDEFAMGSSCEHSALASTRNPWDLARVPGGSSGGSAACVAARSALAALGSDTGGSIREPAAFCGIVGLKPSYGRVSRYGLVAFGSSLDQVGPLTLSVRDAALLLRVMAGRDELDATSAAEPVPDYVAGLEAPVSGLRVGFVPRHFEQCPDRAVAASCFKALQALKARGASLVEIDLPHAELGLSVYYVVASAEASSNLSRFDGVRYGLRVDAGNAIANYFETRARGFGPEVKRRIMLGTHALSAGAYEEYYGRACRVRTLVVRDFQQAFAACDVIAGPTAPFPAFKAGEKADPLSMYLCDIYTIPANLAGLCAISVPAGYSAEGLPLGLHLQAAPFDEARLLRAARAVEADLRLDRLPPIA